MLIFVSAVLILSLSGTWMLSRSLIVERPLEKSDAILVLAGGADHKERNREAARLYRAGVAKKILLTDDGIMSGWDNDRQRNPYFAERARWLLLADGVPGNAIEIIPEKPLSGSLADGQGTEKEAEIVLRFSQEKNIQRLHLVTSPYHTKRALLIFKTAFASADPPIILGISHPPIKDFALGFDAVSDLKTVWSEFVKLQSFRLRHLF